MNEISIKEYCVYTHRDMNGKIFYVGMGNRERPFDVSTSHRSEKWHTHVEEYGLGTIDIIAWYDSKEEALACEEEFTILLKAFGEPLVNIRRGNKYGQPEDHPFFGKEHSEETKKKMSSTKIGGNNPFFGREHSEETKKKIRENNPLLGKFGVDHICFKGIWVGIRSRDSAVIAFAGGTDIKSRGFSQSGISASVRGVYGSTTKGNNYKKFTWYQTLDKVYLNELLEQDNFVDEESSIVIKQFLDIPN